MGVLCAGHEDNYCGLMLLPVLCLTSQGAQSGSEGVGGNVREKNGIILWNHNVRSIEPKVV